MPDSTLPGKSVGKRGKIGTTKTGKLVEIPLDHFIDEMNPEFLIVLTRVRDAVVCSRGVDPDLVCQIDQQVSLIRKNASRCMVEESVCNEWVRVLKRFLRNGFQNAQLQDLYKFLIQVESDMRKPSKGKLKI